MQILEQNDRGALGGDALERVCNDVEPFVF